MSNLSNLIQHMTSFLSFRFGLRSLSRFPVHFYKYYIPGRTLLRWLDASTWADTLLGPGIWVADRAVFSTRSRHYTVSCGMARRNGCYPSRTTERWSSRICIWTRQSQFHVLGNSWLLRPLRLQHIYHRQALLSWIVLPLAKQPHNLSFLRSRVSNTWNTDNMIACKVRIPSDYYGIYRQVEHF